MSRTAELKMKISSRSFKWEKTTQALRIGVAGIVSIYTASLLKLPQGYWAAISAFVVLGSDVKTTFRASGERLIGTAIGALAGGVFAYFWGSQLLWFGVAATLTVLLCEILNLGQSYRLACVTVAIVMLINRNTSPWNTALNRFLEVALGIVIALILSAVPPGRVGETLQTVSPRAGSLCSCSFLRGHRIKQKCSVGPRISRSRLSLGFYCRAGSVPAADSLLLDSCRSTL
jgi:hypothetical protein